MRYSIRAFKKKEIFRFCRGLQWMVTARNWTLDPLIKVIWFDVFPTGPSTPNSNVQSRFLYVCCNLYIDIAKLSLYWIWLGVVRYLRLRCGPGIVECSVWWYRVRKLTTMMWLWYINSCNSIMVSCLVWLHFPHTQCLFQWQGLQLEIKHDVI